MRDTSASPSAHRSSNHVIVVFSCDCGDGSKQWAEGAIQFRQSMGTGTDVVVLDDGLTIVVGDVLVVVVGDAVFGGGNVLDVVVDVDGARGNVLVDVDVAGVAFDVGADGATTQGELNTTRRYHSRRDHASRSMLRALIRHLVLYLA